jgi:hypothetical protein
MGCGDLRRGSAYDCATPLVGGTRPRVFVINKDDITGYTESTSTPNLVTALTFKTGKVANAFEGFRNSVIPSFEMVEAPSGQGFWKHTTNFFVYENTQLWKNELEKFGNGSYITVYQNSKADVNAFEIQGLDNGLTLQPGVVNNKNENGAAYNLILANRAGQEEPKPPRTLFSTDFATTLALIEGYAALPTITTISDLALQVAGGDAETITGTGFYGGGSASDVQSVKWVNQLTGAKTTQTGVTVASNTSITFTSVALTAGTYKLEIVTSRGTALSVSIATAS